MSGHGVYLSTFTIRCRDTGVCSILYSRPTTDRRRPAGPAQTKPQIRQWIAASGSWCSKGDSRQAFPCGKIVRKLESHIRRFAVVICPLCHSEQIHRSKRKGIVERGLLAMISGMPFRCERCDLRFFRWSLTAKPNASRTTSRTITTS